MQNEIYIPNLLRRENIRKINESDKESITDIPYILNFNLEDDLHLNTMMHFQLATLLENIMIFDKVYLDIMDFPVIVDMLYKIDKNITIQLLKNGNLSFINMNEIIIATHKIKNNRYSLAFMSTGNSLYIDNIQKLERILFNSFKYKEELIPYLGLILENAKDVNFDSKSIGKMLVDLTNEELKSDTYLPLGINHNYVINKQNKGIFDAICQVIRDETIASIFKINTVYHDDILREISQIRFKKYHHYINDDFEKLMYLNDIPDIRLLYLNGSLSLKDIMKLKNSNEFKVLQKWIFTHQGSTDVIKDFYLLTQKQSKLDSIPVKTIRFLATTLAGVINPIVGTGASIIDTFGIDMFKGLTPNMFFDKLSQNIKKNNIKSKINKSEKQEVIVPIRESIDIDLTEQKILDNEKDICKKLDNYANQILKCRDSNELISVFNEARSLLPKSPHTFEIIKAYGKCINSATTLDKNICYDFICSLDNIINTYSKDDEFISIFKSIYVCVLVHGLHFGYDNIVSKRLLTLIKHNSYLKLQFENIIQQLESNSDTSSKELLYKCKTIYDMI